MRGCFKSQWFALKQPLALQINDHRLQVTASNNGFAWNIDCYHVLVPFRDAYSTVEVDGIKCAQCGKVISRLWDRTMAGGTSDFRTTRIR